MNRTGLLHRLAGQFAMCVIAWACGADAAVATENPAVLQVGPAREIKTLAEASRIAKDGDRVEVDGGDYAGDVAVWTQNHLQLRAVKGRARLRAEGRSAEGKGIWVVRAKGMLVQGFDFIGARVPDRNGAGIRLESGSLRVRDCVFQQNENGILTSNNADVSLEVEDSEFGFNGAGDGLSHHLYAGTIASLSVSGSYFHHANVGHLLKSRAALNRIRYNRLTDELGGHASYELNLPNGGLAYVIGNIVQQSATTENPYVISYGEEGYRWPRNGLYLVNNTLVDKRPHGGVFLRITPGPVEVKAANNLLAGRSTLDGVAPGEYRANTVVVAAEFVGAALDDYRLKRQSQLRGKAVDAGQSDGESLMPQGEYRHPRHWVRLHGPARHPGAAQSLN